MHTPLLSQSSGLIHYFGHCGALFNKSCINKIFLKKHHKIVELHSPLTNVNGSITEARRAELEIEWSTRLCRELRPNTEHLTHTLL